VRQVGDLIYDVFAIVDEQQSPRGSQPVRHQGAPFDARKRLDEQSLADGRPDVAAALQRREVDHPRPVGKRSLDGAGELDREPRLSNPARTDQRDQPRRPRQRDDFADFALTAEEGVEVRRQIAVRGLSFAADRRECARQARRADLKHAARLHALEVMLAELDEFEMRGGVVARDRLRGQMRDQDLIGVRGPL